MLRIVGLSVAGVYAATENGQMKRSWYGMPVDPFTGEPYHYRTTDDGFLLYSVGQNLTDDNGRHD